MRKSDITRNTILLALENNSYSVTDLVLILIVLVSKLDINTYAGMAQSENKTTDGIRKSKKYRKLSIGRAKLAIKGFASNPFPF